MCVIIIIILLLLLPTLGYLTSGSVLSVLQLSYLVFPPEKEDGKKRKKFQKSVIAFRLREHYYYY